MDAVGTMLNMVYFTSLLNLPPQAIVADGDTFDFIVIGSGIGSIVASRLTENSNITVLLVEAGTHPSDNGILPNTLAAIKGTPDDLNYISGVNQLLSGTLLDGSSSTNHLIQLREAAEDYDGWASYLDDDSWSYSNVQQYIEKFDTMEDDDVMPSAADFFGINDPIIASIQPSDITRGFLESCEEIGLPRVADLNTNVTVGCAGTSFKIGDGIRQSIAYRYLNNLERSNLNLLLETTAQKIIFEDNIAKGVTLKRADGEIINVYANNEVIVSAGAIGSPKLLLQSGVGPQDDLEVLGIEVIQDLPVGQELLDHYAVLLVHKMEKTSEDLLALTDNRLPVVLLSNSLDSAQNNADYTVLGLLMAQDISQDICSTLFGFNDDICSAIYASVTGKNQFTSLIGASKGTTKGTVTLNSANPEGIDMINEGFYSDPEGENLNNMKKFVKNFLTLDNTTYFKEVNAEIADHGLTDCGDADFSDDTFLECFIKAMTVHLYHPTGTCGMGRVTNSNGEVYGLEHLRVVDVSIVPNITTFSTMAAGIMIGEKISDIIKDKYNFVEDIDECYDVETIEEEISSISSSDRITSEVNKNLAKFLGKLNRNRRFPSMSIST